MTQENTHTDTEDSQIVKEKTTDLLYEARDTGDSVIVKPAAPGFDDALEKMTHEEFQYRFDEFWGDPETVHAMIEDDDEEQVPFG